MRVEQRPETVEETGERPPIAVLYVRVDAHPGWEVVVMEDAGEGVSGGGDGGSGLVDGVGGFFCCGRHCLRVRVGVGRGGGRKSTAFGGWGSRKN